MKKSRQWRFHVNKLHKIAGCLLGMASVLATGTALASLTWSNPVMLSGLDVESTGTSGALVVWVNTATTPSNVPSCATGGYELTGTADAVKTMTATATSMFLAGKPVKLLWNGCVAGTTSAAVAGLSN